MRVSTVRTSIAALTLFAMPAKARSADAWQIGSAPSFSSGTYGTDVRTGVFHTPINVRRLFADGDLTVQFPFLCVSGTGVTIVGGTPVPSQSSDAPQRPASDAGRDLRQGAAARTQPARTATTCGIGDIEVRGRYYFVDEGGWRPTVAVRGHFKAPTASEEHGIRH
jgi:hypothetical protein